MTPEEYRKKNKSLIKKKQNLKRYGIINIDFWIARKKCQYCLITNHEYKIKTGRRLDINHIDNLGRAAYKYQTQINNSKNNLEVACRSCHMKNGKKFRFLSLSIK